MLELLGAFVAGVLTTLAPCVLPLLPVVVGGSVAGVGAAGTATVGSSGTRPDGVGPVDTVLHTQSRRLARRRAYVITASLGASVLAFTLLLKASTRFIGVPVEVWQWVSGGLLIGLGIVSVFPEVWELISARLQLQARTSRGLGAARQREGVVGQVLTGAALGPVFTSCSPLYAYVLVTVIPSNTAWGVLLLAVYTLGLCVTLLAVALLGQRAVRRLGWAADPHGTFRRLLGLVFVVVGVLVATGWQREAESWLLEHSPLRPWSLDSGFLPD